LFITTRSLTPIVLLRADLNGDGRPYLVSANARDSTLTVLTNDGGGGFGAGATLNAGSYPHSVAVADVNGDGKPDLVSANLEDNTLTVLLNTTPFMVPLRLDIA
jgi:hypothetical protein